MTITASTTSNTCETCNVLNTSTEISIHKFLLQDTKTQEQAWYDYFCEDNLIPRKTDVLVNCLSDIAESSRIDQDNQYVFFKNNQPLQGQRYDDFRICDRTTRKVIYTISPVWGFEDDKQGKAVVYGAENDFVAPLVVGDWTDVVAYFGCTLDGITEDDELAYLTEEDENDIDDYDEEEEEDEENEYDLAYLYAVDGY